MRDYQQAHLDPRSPMVLDTRDLPRSPGALRVVERVIAAPPDLGLELIRVPEGADLALTLRLESVSEGVLVSARVQAGLTGECGRCLREISDTLDVTFQELYAYANSTTDETTDEDEVGRMQGDLIDLEPELRDAVVLALPNHPLCRENCPGLCPECGAQWDELPADHSHRQVDPRWAALNTFATGDGSQPEH
jgi:uncharacterized protein